MPTPSIRPRQVSIACVLAGAGSAVVLVSAAATLSDWNSSRVRDQVATAIADHHLNREGLGLEQMLGYVRVALIVIAAVSVVSLICAAFAARGHRGARNLLSALSLLTLPLGLAGGPEGLLLAVAAIACLVLLWTAPARAWFTRRPS